MRFRSPGAYDRGRSIGQAIVHLADTPAERAVLKDLVELYPGDLICGSTMPGYNSVLERIAALMKKPDGPELAERLLRRVENAAKRLASEFPGRYAETKRTLADHIARVRAILEAGDPGTGRKGRTP